MWAEVTVKHVNFVSLPIDTQSFYMGLGVPDRETDSIEQFCSLMVSRVWLRPLSGKLLLCTDNICELEPIRQINFASWGMAGAMSLFRGECSTLVNWTKRDL